jgi:hypothetical protein
LRRELRALRHHRFFKSQEAAHIVILTVAPRTRCQNRDAQ